MAAHRPHIFESGDLPAPPRAVAQSAPPTLPNLALGQRTTQSGGGTAFRAVDGTASIAITPTESESWWEVDLGTIQSITTIVVQRNPGCCWEQPLVAFVSDTQFASTSHARTRERKSEHAAPTERSTS